MSTSATPVRRPSRFANNKLSFLGVVRSEWLKLRSVSSTWVQVLVIVACMVGMGMLSALIANSLADSILDNLKQEGVAPTAEALQPAINSLKSAGSTGMIFANMLVASLAVVFIASEYANNSIQASLAAVPNRGMFYIAKALVLAVFSFILGTVLAVCGYFAAVLVVNPTVKEFVVIDNATVMNWIATGSYFMFMALIGLGFGSFLRSTAGGIVVTVVIMFILPIAANFLSGASQWVADATNYLPSTLGSAMTSVGLEAADATYSRVEAGLFFGLWTLLIAGLGYIRIRFTDSK